MSSHASEDFENVSVIIERGLILLGMDVTV